MNLSQKTRMLATMGAFLVVAGGAAAYAYWGVHEAEKEQQARDDAERRLLSLEKDAIARLEVKARGQTTLLEKDDEGWRITSPVQARADRAAVDDILAQITGARRERKIEAADPAKFGLAEPKVTVAAYDAAGVRAEIALGNENSFDGSLFVRDASGAIGTTRVSLRSALDKSTFDLRDKRLVVVGQDTVQEIALSNGIRIGRNGDRWELVAPVQEPADGPTVDAIVRALQDMRAMEFEAEKVEKPEELAAWRLDRPAFTVELHRGDQPTIAVAFGEKDGSVYARANDGPIAKVAASALESVRKDLDALRDKQLFAFDTTKVRRVRVEGGDAPIELELRDKDWWIVAPKEAKARQWKASGLLSTLRALRAEALAPGDADPKAYGLAEPRHTVVALDESGNEVARLLVGREESARTWVGAGGRIASVETTRMKNIVVDLASLEEPPPEPKKEESAAADGAGGN